MEIRLAVTGDEDDLARLNKQVQEFHFQREPGHFKPFNQEAVSCYFRELLKSDRSRIWLAAVNNSVVGYISVFVRHRGENAFCRKRILLEIDQISVEEKYQRSGLGSALIEKAIVFASGEGVSDIELNSWNFNENAHRAFNSMGFVPQSVRFRLEKSDES